MPLAQAAIPQLSKELDGTWKLEYRGKIWYGPEDKLRAAKDKILASIRLSRVLEGENDAARRS